MSDTREIDFRDFARQVGTVVDVDAGSAIFSEGDVARAMYIVLRGAVEITSHGKHLETIGAGDALGIISMLDEKPRTATARASEPSEIAIIERKKFRYMIEEMPNFCWYVMSEMAHRLRITNAAL